MVVVVVNTEMKDVRNLYFLIMVWFPKCVCRLLNVCDEHSNYVENISLVILYICEGGDEVKY